MGLVLMLGTCLLYVAWGVYFLLGVALGDATALWVKVLAWVVASLFWAYIGKQLYDLYRFWREFWE